MDSFCDISERFLETFFGELRSSTHHSDSIVEESLSEDVHEDEVVHVDLLEISMTSSSSSSSSPHLEDGDHSDGIYRGDERREEEDLKGRKVCAEDVQKGQAVECTA